MNDPRTARVDRRTVLGVLGTAAVAAGLGLSPANPVSAMADTSTAATEPAPADSAPQAATRYGKVRGKRGADGGSVFLGIPYARPPVGDLRLAPPVPPVAWQSVREAVAFGPAVPQTPPNTTVPSGDDWLNLNIWLPPGVTKPVPVMVWIYGGGYARGSADEPTFDGSVLAREGQVAVVTFNYRTGVEGSPTFRALSPTVVSSTRWHCCAGCATTSAVSAVTPARSPFSVSLPGRVA